MFTMFQRTVLVVLAFGFLVVAIVVAAKAPAQATTFAPAVSVPVNASSRRASSPPAMRR